MGEDRQEYGKAHTFRPISERVAAVKTDISRIPHDKEFKVGKDVRYPYTSSDGVLDNVRPLLAREQLDVITSIVEFRIDAVEVTAYDKKQTKRYATMKAEILLACPGTLDSCNVTGETREKPSTWFLEHEYNGPQTSEAMVTYLEKMFLRARFQISTGVDIEQGQESENKREAPKQQAAPPAHSEALTPGQLLFRDIRGKYEAADSEETLKAAMDFEDFNAEELAKIPEKGRAGIKAAREAATQRIMAKGKEAGNE